MAFRPTRRAFVAALAALPLAARTAEAEDRPVTVFAAASLKTALDSLIAARTRGGGAPVVASYAASSALARQIEQGAPADVFLSADEDWMDYLAERGLIESGSRRTLVGNRLVLVKPADSPALFDPKRAADLPALLAGGRLAVGETKSVPAGKYARAALTSLGLWEGLRDRLAEVESVRAALMLVARGEAPFGIVYASDAKAEPKVAVAGVFPEDSHPPIRYPAAIVQGSTARGAREFLEFLSSPAARAVFADQGFSTAAD